MVLGFVVCMWQGGLSWRPGGLAWWIFGFFLLLTLFQMVPLSKELLDAVSPFRAQLLERAGEALEFPDSRYAIAYSVYQAFAQWGFVVCLALFFWMSASIANDRKTFKVMVWLLIGVGIFESLYGMIQVIFPQVGIWWVPSEVSDVGTARGTFINRNHFAGLMEMIWPLALGVTLAQGEWEDQKGFKAMLAEDQLGNQLTLLVFTVLMILALLTSQSRAGILGSFLGFAVFMAILRTATGRFRWGFRIAIFSLLALVALYGSQMGFDQVIDRFLLLDKGAVGRMRIWTPTWEMVMDHPSGIGLGNYSIVEPVYVDREGYRNYYAHNDYLQLLAEAGWAGAAVLVGGFFFFLVRAMRRVRKVGFRVGRFRLLVSVGALAGLCSMGFHSFFDFGLHMPANAVYFVVLMALVEAGLWPNKKTN